MNYLKISNLGEIDLESLTLLGASSKRGDSSKIGMFGSGNKYALAFLLRNGYEVSIYSGLEEIRINTIQKKHRGQNFDVMCFNGKESSITTEFGKDWKLWQAIREIYCNALDEGGHKIEYVTSVSPAENETHFYIKTRAEIPDFVSNFDTYFAVNQKVLFECEYGRIIEKTKESFNLFRKGVRCFESNKKSIYDYDLYDVDIDENRLVRYSFQVPSFVWNLIYQCTDKIIIRNILMGCSDPEYIECISEDYNYINTGYMSQEYKEVLNEIKMAPRSMSGLLSAEEIGSTTIIPSLIFGHAKPLVSNNNLANKFKVYQNGFYVDIDLTELHNLTIEKAFDFFRESEYLGPLGYAIKAARFEDKTVLGFADIQNQCIVISEICLDKGVQAVIQCLIEEYIHLNYEVMDETRGFQNAAILEIVSILKRKYAFLT